MINNEEELKELVKALEPKSVIEGLEFNEIVYKYYQGCNIFDGEYKGKVTDHSGKIFLCFYIKNKLLLYDNEDLTIAQHTELMKIPNYEQ